MLRYALLSVDFFAVLETDELSIAERRLCERMMLGVFSGIIAADMFWRQKNMALPMLYDAGIVYGPDPIRTIEETGEKITEEFKTSNRLYLDKVGDCDDLAPARAGELLSYNQPADVYVDFTRINQRYTYHVLTRRKKIDRYLPPGKSPRKSMKTARGLKVILVDSRDLPVLWEAPNGQGFIEDPSRVLGM